MPIEILMPALSPTMKVGTLSKWLKSQGSFIKPGEVIAEIETDKATMEVEAVDEGVLAKIIVPAGTESVEVNSPIAIMLLEGEDESSLASFEVDIKQEDSLVSLQGQQINNFGNDLEINKKETATRRVFASPLAKKLATQNNIDIAEVKGSGPHGRVIKEDIIKAVNQSSSVTASDDKPSTLVPNTGMRKIIAERLVEAKRSIPHFYLTVECCIDSLLEIRKQINEDNPEHKISVNDFIIKAAALALEDVPEVNATWEVEAIRYYDSIDICVAVSVEGGLVTPVIFDIKQKSLLQISHVMKILVEKAKSGRLLPEEYQGGNFTISNLGMYGIRQFSAIINPPQSAILAIGSAAKQVIPDGNSFKVATIANITLSCDHRVVDGVLGAKWLASFKKFIENPLKMLI